MVVFLGLFTTLFNCYCEWTKREMYSIDVNAACFARKKRSGSSCFPILQSGRLSSVLECGTLVTLDRCHGVIFVYSWFKTCGKSESRNSGISAGKVYPAWDAHGVPVPCRRTFPSYHMLSSTPSCSIVRLKRDGTRAETRSRLLPKRTSPFKSAGASVQSTAGSRGVRISVSNAGYTMFQGSEGYWLPTPFSSFLFTSPPLRQRVPSGFKRTCLVFDWFLVRFTAWTFGSQTVRPVILWLRSPHTGIILTSRP